MNKSQQITLNQDELQHLLEPLIRRVIREELLRAAAQRPDIFLLHPNMPLYGDMGDIAQRKVADTIELFSHEKVWSE
ncbi:MAG: hypothetical protein GY801_07825 [bacterium]|nr:hypothetical protein [bacterium]